MLLMIQPKRKNRQISFKIDDSDHETTTTGSFKKFEFRDFDCKLLKSLMVEGEGFEPSKAEPSDLQS